MKKDDAGDPLKPGDALKNENFDKYTPAFLLMDWRTLRSGAVRGVLLPLLCACLRAPLLAQTQPVTGEEIRAASDWSMTGWPGLNQWDTLRKRLENAGYNLAFVYTGDNLANVQSEQKPRFSVWTRARGTLNIDLARTVGIPDSTIHLTAVWQGGSNLGQYLNLAAGPSGIATQGTFRLDSWWLEKYFRQRSIAMRVGQFSGQDSYGAQHFGNSFVVEPLNYDFNNLPSVAETYNPPSTPAAELRLLPSNRVYVQTMVMAGDRSPYSHNPTGLIPQFRGAAVFATEFGYSLGTSVHDLTTRDTPGSRVGYSGLYKVGSVVNPGTFHRLGDGKAVSVNQMWYVMATQAVWRQDRHGARGLDITAAVDWSPQSRNQQFTTSTTGLRFNQFMRVKQENTMTLGYVRSVYSGADPAGATPLQRKPEQAIEYNILIQVNPFVSLQPVVQHFFHASGGSNSATVTGFHANVSF